MAMTPGPATMVSARTRAKITTNLSVMALAAIAIFGFANYFAGQSRFRTAWDWTSLGANTLSPKTTGLLAELGKRLGKDNEGHDRVIELVSFLVPQAMSQQAGMIEVKAIDLVHQLIDAYVVAGHGRVAFTSFDGYGDVAKAKKKIKDLKLKENPNGDEVVMALGDRVRTIRLGDLVRINYGMRGGAMYGMPDEPATIEENKIEETLTANMLAILESEKPKAYFIVGHGEPDIDSSKRDGLSRLADLLRGIGYDVSALALAERDGVPADARVVLWISPQRLMHPKELATLKQYANSGGRLIVAPDLPQEPGLDADALALLAEYGIRSPNGLVCVPVVNSITGEQIMGRPESAGLTRCRSVDLSSASPITRSFFEQRISLPTPITRAFEKIVGEENKTQAFTEDLAHTTKDSWIDLEPLDFSCDPAKEPRGPKTVVTSGTMKAGGAANGSAPASGPASSNAEGRLVAIGSAMLANNENFDFGRDLYLASIEWAAGREYAAGIGARPIGKNALADTQTMLPKIVGASLLLTGLAFIAAGYVWYLRRGTRLGFFLGVGVGALPLLIGILSLLFRSAF
jgi:ABC transporter family protein